MWRNAERLGARGLEVGGAVAGGALDGMRTGAVCRGDTEPAVSAECQEEKRCRGDGEDWDSVVSPRQQRGSSS